MTIPSRSSESPQDLVQRALGQLSRQPIGSMNPGARIAEDLGIDSLDFVRLVQILEELGGVSLPDEAVVGVTTVADLTAAVAACTSNR